MGLGSPPYQKGHQLSLSLSHSLTRTLSLFVSARLAREDIMTSALVCRHEGNDFNRASYWSARAPEVPFGLVSHITLLSLLRLYSSSLPKRRRSCAACVSVSAWTGYPDQRGHYSTLPYTHTPW